MLWEKNRLQIKKSKLSTVLTYLKKNILSLKATIAKLGRKKKSPPIELLFFHIINCIGLT